MKKKLLVTIFKPSDIESIRSEKCEVLAEYPNSVLVRASAQQEDALRTAGFEIEELGEPPIQSAGARFMFAQAMEADKSAPVAADPTRTAYYIVKLVGPPKGDWLAAIKAAGGVVQTSLPGYALLVGMRPPALQAVKQQPWVEGVSPYRASMKIAPDLRAGVPAELTAKHLAMVETPADAAAREQVEVTVFPGESSESVAAQVRSSGGVVLNTTPTALKAIIPQPLIAELAAKEGVQAIVRHHWPKLHNDKAAAVMDAPADRHFADLTIRGSNQLVAIADTGLDTGNPATIQPDFAGRVTQIVSLPNHYPQYANDPPPYDDGPADTDPHGTHVAGSVLASGAAAVAAGAGFVPEGVAPDAHVYFQAVQQDVHWKTRQQVIAAGLGDPGANWPPDEIGLWGLPDDLNELFNPAYTAGARIHTNSWGASADGDYDTQARDVDSFMWNHRDMLIVFSAGNEGTDANGDGVIDLGSMGSPGTAKNCITVGASENNRPAASDPPPGYDFNWTDWNTSSGPAWPHLGAAGHLSDNTDGMAAFSSRGPTKDHRIKPDVVAPGTNILSTRSAAYAAVQPPLWADLPTTHPLYKKYCWSGGTSMSAPLVAGAAALVRQHLVEHRDHPNPSAALIKAFLVNGAKPMTGQFAGEIPAPPPGPNTSDQNPVCGFGRVDLAESLTPGLLKRTLFADDPNYAVETGQTRTFQVAIINPAEPLAVTLSWTDYPALPGVGGLVNQLYLRLKMPDGTFVDGDATAYPTVQNNVQRVLIAAPPAGTYEIRVYGISVTKNSPAVPVSGNARQDFALVLSNGMGMSLLPVSLAQAIDTTGSMDYFHYMEPAKARANQLADFLRINDRLSITEFSDRAGLPHARTPYALRTLGNFSPDWSDAHAAVNALHADGLTPIGDGLLAAWGQLSHEIAGRPKAIVLLSDGLNNVPPDPLDVLSSGAIPNDVPIFTIALGPAGNTSALEQIAASRPGGAYFVIDGDEDIFKLHQIYAQIQALSSGMTLVGLSSIEATNTVKKLTVPLEAGALEAAFVLSWDGVAQELQYIVTGPNGKQYKSGVPSVIERRGPAWAIVRVDAPPAGVWTVQLRSAKDPVKCVFSAAVQASLQLSAAAVIRENRLTITARMFGNGKPLDQAVVTAAVQVPAISRKEIQRKYATRITKVELPASVLEKGLNKDQIALTRLAAFARQFASKPEGLFGRKTTQVTLNAVRPGIFRAELPLKADGNVTVTVTARQGPRASRWERVATVAAFS